jgi:hypothetical protein
MSPVMVYSRPSRMYLQLSVHILVSVTLLFANTAIIVKVLSLATSSRQSLYNITERDCGITAEQLPRPGILRRG